ncbi:MAG: hypothetical protein O3C63_05470 [Cyanobacteria bacterium]|nr:hypothetical protein [Cyanobacteriota bacterium]
MHTKGTHPEIFKKPQRLVHSGPNNLSGAPIRPSPNEVCTGQYAGNFVFASTDYVAAKAYAFKQNGNTFTTFSLDKPMVPIIVSVNKESYLNFLKEQDNKGYQHEFNSNQFEEVLKRNPDGSRVKTGEWVSETEVRNYTTKELDFLSLIKNKSMQVFFINPSELNGQNPQSKIQEIMDLKIHTRQGLQQAMDQGLLTHYNVELKKQDPEIKVLNLNTGLIN